MNMNCDFHLPLPMQLPQVLQINWVQSHQWPIWYSSNWIAHCRFCLTYICNFLFRLYIWLIMQQYAYKGRKGQRIIIFNALREFCFNSKSTNPPFSLDPGRKDQTLECYLAHKHFLLLLVRPWMFSCVSGLACVFMHGIYMYRYSRYELASLQSWMTRTITSTNSFPQLSDCFNWRHYTITYSRFRTQGMCVPTFGKAWNFVQFFKVWSLKTQVGVVWRTCN